MRSPDPRAARAALEDAVFASARLKTLLPRLERRLTAIEHIEEKARWNAVYEELIPRRDELAAELKAVYTEFAPKLAEVMARVARMDREIARARQTRPRQFAGEAHDARELGDVEATARGYTHLEGPDLVTLRHNLFLPDWANPLRRAWPPYPNETQLDPEEHTLDAKARSIAQARDGLEQRAVFERQQQQPQQPQPKTAPTGGEQQETHYRNRDRELRAEFDRSLRR